MKRRALLAVGVVLAAAACLYIDHLTTPPGASRYVLAFASAGMLVLCLGLLVKPSDDGTIR